MPPGPIVHKAFDNGTHGVRNLSASKINLIALFAFFSIRNATVCTNLKIGPSLSLFSEPFAVKHSMRVVLLSLFSRVKVIVIETFFTNIALC